MELFTRNSTRFLRFCVHLIVLLFIVPAAFGTTVITSDTVLGEHLFDNVVIGADDVTLDCDNRKIEKIEGFPPTTGIVLNSRSGVTIKNCKVSGFLTGIQANGASSLTLIDIVVRDNAINGLEANGGSSVAVSGKFTARRNGVFGILLSNNATMTMTGADVILALNTGGMQLGVSSSLLVVAMPPLPETEISAHNNDAFGITVVSNSHAFLFGSVDVTSRNNGSNGISIFTKSGIELDNGATITAKNNVLNGILLEDSTLNMFNMPQFPGSTLKLQNNGVAGVSVAKASVFDVGGDGFVTSTNSSVGIGVDDGSTATIRNSEVVGNDEDLVLTFAARADLVGNTIGSISCDETVLIRGDELCPDDEDDEDEDD